MAFAFEKAQVCVQVIGTPHKAQQNTDFQLNNAKFKTVTPPYSYTHARIHTHSHLPSKIEEGI